MLRILIADDEPHACKLIRELLREEPDTTVVAECRDGVAALTAIRELAPDLVFLDIKMPGLSGLQVGRLLRTAQPPCIVFITAYEEHALDAFAVDAVDYLLKPVDEERFHAALEKARNRLARHPANAPPSAPVPGRTMQISVKDGARVHFFKLGDIVYIRADSNYLHVRTADRKQTMIRGRLRTMEQRLCGTGFVRVSRSLLLNLDHVIEITPRQHGDHEFLLSDGERVFSGITYREAIQRLLSNAVGP